MVGMICQGDLTQSDRSIGPWTPMNFIVYANTKRKSELLWYQVNLYLSMKFTAASKFFPRNATLTYNWYFIINSTTGDWFPKLDFSINKFAVLFDPFCHKKNKYKKNIQNKEILLVFYFIQLKFIKKVLLFTSFCNVNSIKCECLLDIAWAREGLIVPTPSRIPNINVKNIFFWLYI